MATKSKPKCDYHKRCAVTVMRDGSECHSVQIPQAEWHGEKLGVTNRFCESCDKEFSLREWAHEYYNMIELPEDETYLDSIPVTLCKTCDPICGD